ncbi:hypothetical protein ANCDUO_06970 [Ancylostoma duodenale]|uniref:Uncharacterized protein n=1 Tax=Ancylostoma duodenale TaxID=51022 RepID=A0A0C2GUS7_9BILA|nr:hypothetical protein ANCDUO_06970 [Ancylostoma duodenale]
MSCDAFAWLLRLFAPGPNVAASPFQKKRLKRKLSDVSAPVSEPLQERSNVFLLCATILEKRRCLLMLY